MKRVDVSRFSSLVRKHPELMLGLALAIPVVLLYLYALTTLEIKSKLLFSTASALLVFFVGAISLDLEVGSLGLPNFGKVAFFALGAYTSALLYSVYDVSYPVAVIAALIISSLFGYVLSIPTVKLRADYFAIMTIAGGEFIRFVFQNEKRWLWAPSILPPYTPTQIISNRAKTELTTISPFNMRLGDLDIYQVLETIENLLRIRIFTALDIDQLFVWEVTLLAVFLLIALVTYWFIERIRRSPYGRTLRAIREDDITVTSVGKDVSRFRWQVTTISAFICGLAGVMYAFSFNAFEASDFRPELTFVLYFYVIIGGLGNGKGVFVGTALVTLFMQAASVEAVQRNIYMHVGPDSPFFGSFLEILQLDIFINPFNMRYVVLGTILILFLLFKPGGLIPEPRTDNEKYLSLLTPDERARSDEAVSARQSLTEKERLFEGTEAENDS
ncbi:MAG: branched-chain amino acid ABC transporter permease [Euryarchaeota archaeon]|nr:MAG: putative branched-chain amino acid transport system permease protein [ANME-2 cluster archaeon]MEA1864300.1 branched-chain amino acid ABC transporter permease [Euryarchaeota archaeon]